VSAQASPKRRPLLSVVVPVFNQAASIVENLEVIRERVHAGLGGDFEIVVVSDGSIDETEGELVARAPAGAVRVFHYDRNLGKGYAVKLGALEAHGAWIGFVDADLDLDPAALPSYVRRAQERDLDFAIGSKRHPDSQVAYPPSRVFASWLFQQLVRLLFRLDVRDTQAGIKVFRREVAEQVLPLLLVKRYAFDIELLAVACAFGFTRIEEMPITLDYQFTGSGVRSRAVLRALVDTAAIFYRLRLLRYYQRRRRISGAYAFTRPRSAPSVTVLLPRGGSFRERDFPHVEVIEVGVRDPRRPTVGDFREAAVAASGAVVAILEPGVRAAGNWLSATAPFLLRPELGAVVTPKVAPGIGAVRARAAAGVVESRVGAGPGYFGYTPGNIRIVRDFPAAGIVVRRDVLLDLDASVPLRDVVAAVTRRGDEVLYTPESVVVAEPAPLFRPHLRLVWSRGLARGGKLRRGEFGRPTVFAALVAALVVLAVLLCAAFLDLSAAEAIVLGIAAAYVLAVLVAAAAAALRHQSLAVGWLVVLGIVFTHIVYLVAVARALVLGR
jgi:glycosyltransferase involved in cell wall biosynthesis